MQCDYAGLSLQDAENKQLRLYALDFPEGKGSSTKSWFIRSRGSPSGTAFRTMEASDAPEPFAAWLDSPIAQIAVREGFEVRLLFTLDQPESWIWRLGSRRLRDDAFQSG